MYIKISRPQLLVRAEQIEHSALWFPNTARSPVESSQGHPRSPSEVSVHLRVDMDHPANAGHVACQSFRRFVLECLAPKVEYSCTCLSDDSNSICERYPHLESLIRSVYRDAQAFQQALSSTSSPAPGRVQELLPRDDQADNLLRECGDGLKETELGPIPFGNRRQIAGRLSNR